MKYLEDRRGTTEARFKVGHDRTVYLAAYKCLETIKHLFDDADAIKCYDAILAYSQNN